MAAFTSFSAINAFSSTRSPSDLLPAPSAPTNIALPSISGTPIDGTAWTLSLGTWSGTITQLEIEVRTVETVPVVLLDRQVVTADTTGSIDGAVGKSIEFRVWASNGAASTLATSTAFGPVAIAGDIFVLGLALNTAEQGLPSSPFQFTNLTGTTTSNTVVKHGATTLAESALYPVENPNPGMDGLSFGFNGTADIGGTNTISVNNFADSRLKGRMGASLLQTAGRLRIDLPGAGVYRIYAGLGFSSSNVAVNLGVWDGLAGAGGTSLHQMGPVNDSDNAISVVDINGTVRTVEAWAAVAGPGMGDFVEVTVGVGAFITVARSTNGGAGATQLATISVFKKAA